MVEIRTADELVPAFEERIAAGFLYGDFQIAIDPASDDFLRRGVFSSYLPVAPDTPVPADQRALRADDWLELLHLAHTRKAEAFRRYERHYLATDGQTYWSDTHQLGVYLDDYHDELDARLGAPCRATEVIGEVYVPCNRLADFLDDVREDFRRHAVDLIYGTIRLIRRDDETFLPWAKADYACVVVNLHTEHTPAGLRHSADAFRRLTDLALARDGSFYLTYHRFAARRQVETAYPQFREFLRRKRAIDPEGRFQSDWYRHQRALFAEEGARRAG